MKRNLNLFCLAALTLLLFFAAGCKKDLMPGGSRPALNSLRTDVDPAIAPTVEDGILAFRDKDHLAGYLSFVDSVLNDTTINDDTVNGTSERFAAIESQFSYTSLRSVLETQWDNLNAIGFDLGSGVPSLFHFESPLWRSVYNSDKNLKIGSAVNHFYNSEVAIYIRDANPDIVSEINGLSTGLSYEDLLNTYAANDNIVVYRHTTDRRPWFQGSSMWKITSGVFRTWFSIERTQAATCDDPYRKYEIRKVVLKEENVDDLQQFNNSSPQSHALDIWVDWGDGSTQTFSNVNIVISGTTLTWPNVPQTHIYANGGTYNVKIKVKRPSDVVWVAEATQSVDIPVYLCGGWTSKKSGEHYQYADGWCVGGTVETFQGWFSNFFNWDATTKAYKIENNKRKHKKAHRIVAQVWTNLYAGCSGNSTYKDDGEWPFNDKSTTARIWQMASSPTDYSIVYSNHRVYYNSSDASKFINMDLNMPRCQ